MENLILLSLLINCFSLYGICVSFHVINLLRKEFEQFKNEQQ